MIDDYWLDEVGKGWRELLVELDAKLSETWPNYIIYQVKEKFGTLRYYATHQNEDKEEQHVHSDHTAWNEHNATFHDIIREYETRSAQICEHCGQPGHLGRENYWWATRCDECAPEGWQKNTDMCHHENITNNKCDTCMKEDIARLEHSDTILSNVHKNGTCMGETCTIHKMSAHSMRSWPQSWRQTSGYMERICTHNLGHPDPDEIISVRPHACDGCCKEEEDE